MDAITYSAARKRLNETMERVVQDREPVVIVRQKGEPVVMMSLDDYNSLMESVTRVPSPAGAPERPGRSGRRAFLIEELSEEDASEIAKARVPAEHAHLDALLDD